MIITKFLEQNAKLYPEDIAIVEINPQHEFHEDSWTEYSLVESAPGDAYRREISWSDFDRRANRFANVLLANGIKKGDKVAILLMNCLEWLPIYFGILKMGALAVPMNYRYSSDEIRYCLDLSDASVLIFGPEFKERIAAIHKDIPAIKLAFFVGGSCPDYALSYFQYISYCSSRNPGIALSPSDDAAIYFSSGTTGFPKAILHNHESLTHAALCEQSHHGQTREDCFLCIPPLYHTGAKMHWFGSLVSGSSAVILRGVSPKWIIETVSLEHCTIVWLLVPWAQDILDAIDRGEIELSKYELTQWRLMHIGAQPVPPSLIHRWKQVFPKHQYDTNYGLTESIGPGCVHLGVDNIHKVGAIGKPGFGWQARIVDSEGNDLANGKVGELLISGPGLMSCYYHDPKATNEVLRDGWLYTGDMAMMDEESFIYLVDRKKDVIITGGENLYPVQIEDFIRGYKKVKDVAVIGRPDPRLGEIASAIIEIREGMTCTKEEIEEFCMAMPRYKRPREIIFDIVPRNPTGKIEKPVLRKKYGALALVAQQTEIIE
ncbi:MAG: class I adenylate-forming enzyme family protein [Christensenellales bacterium]|jgi:long-chain acyl-CoA synthetase